MKAAWLDARPTLLRWACRQTRQPDHSGDGGCRHGGRPRPGRCGTALPRRRPPANPGAARSAATI